MKDGWIDRLWRVIDADRRSLRAISVAADLGVNYLSQTRSRGTHPVTDKLASILDVLGPEAALYVMTGLEMSAEDQAFLHLLAGYDADQKQAVRQLIEAALARQASAEQPPSPPASDAATGQE